LTTYDKVSLDGNNVVVTYHETQEIADAGSPFIVVSRDFKEDKIFFARLQIRLQVALKLQQSLETQTPHPLLLQESYTLVEPVRSNFAYHDHRNGP
jgi:hypothetical protein